ncbi:hypothetical protein RND81_11G094600 [Saponaria officinalis]|uniref:Uncharacterized protein n=1 Tax=Saponaria officinalis TaxID=3572 RepID=A0AAW1HK87_SAPOF
MTLVFSQGIHYHHDRPRHPYEAPWSTQLSRPTIPSPISLLIPLGHSVVIASTTSLIILVLTSGLLSLRLITKLPDPSSPRATTPLTLSSSPTPGQNPSC